jgi:hypothetical protein
LALGHTGGAIFLVYIGSTRSDARVDPIYWLVTVGIIATAITFAYLLLRGVGLTNGIGSNRVSRLISLWMDARERELRRRAGRDEER